MAEVEFRRAIRDALDEELARDKRVLFFGEDVAPAGGVFVVTPGLADKYPGRVLARISEQALDRLDDVWRITRVDTPIPYSPTLEDAFLPSPTTIVDSILTRVKPMKSEGGISHG